MSFATGSKAPGRAVFAMDYGEAEENDFRHSQVPPVSGLRRTVSFGPRSQLSTSTTNRISDGFPPGSRRGRPVAHGAQARDARRSLPFPRSSCAPSDALRIVDPRPLQVARSRSYAA